LLNKKSASKRTPNIHSFLSRFSGTRGRRKKKKKENSTVLYLSSVFSVVKKSKEREGERDQFEGLRA
jgi:hypothetical protein